MVQRYAFAAPVAYLSKYCEDLPVMLNGATVIAEVRVRSTEVA
jgi:hypothetical protein